MDDWEMPAAKSGKSDRTRAIIVDTAIDLFRERGYEETTMREIAQRAGVALGSAYYYFASKEHLVQALYARMQEEQLIAFEGVFESKGGLKERLLGLLLAELAAIEPYHKISLVLFRSGADPASPLSPFSEASRPIRETAIAVFERLVRESNERIPEDLKTELPYLLWLYQMGIILFWIYDKSFCRIRSQRLILHSVDIICRLVTLASLPLMLPVRKRLLKLLADLRAEQPFLDLAGA